MPTSDLHRQLVAHLAEQIEQALGPVADVHADHRLALSWPVPPSLGDARPDVFARRRKPAAVIIGEAKTRRDIDHPHTEAQLACYFEYLKVESAGELWLAVPWTGLDSMYFLANRCRRLAGAATVGFRVMGVAWERSLYCRTVRG